MNESEAKMKDRERKLLTTICELRNAVKDEINHLKWKIGDYEDEIIDMQRKMNKKKDEIKKLETKMRYAQILVCDMTESECIDFIINSAPDYLQGQFLRKRRWNITNGYIWIDSVERFKGVSRIASPNYDNIFDRINPEEHCLVPVEEIYPEPAKIIEKDNTLLVKVGNSWVQMWLVKLACMIVGQPLRIECGGKGSPVAFECKRGRAFFAPFRYLMED